MNIPLLYLLERMGIKADVSGVASDALVRSVQLADRALCDGRAPESGVLYIGSDGENGVAGGNGVATWNGVTFGIAALDVYEAFNRAVDICFRFQEFTERFNDLLNDAGNADALMRECSAVFGNAAYMVDSAFKVIAKIGRAHV